MKARHGETQDSIHTKHSTISHRYSTTNNIAYCSRHRWGKKSIIPHTKKKNHGRLWNCVYFLRVESLLTMIGVWTEQEQLREEHACVLLVKCCPILGADIFWLGLLGSLVALLKPELAAVDNHL